MFLEYLYLSCLVFSAIVATWFHRELKSRQLFLFVPYLWLLSIQELTLTYCLHKNIIVTTGLIYNIYRPICTGFFVLLFYRMPINAPVRKLMAWLFSVYLAVTLVTFFFIQHINIYNSYLSLAGGFVITCCSIFFLFNYFNLDNLAEEKKTLSVIWITVGVITFYPIVNITFAFYKFLLAYDASIFGIPLYKVVPRVMSVFMYSCFSYAFYLCRKKN
ncbi:MAG: hypothetical protein EOO01_05350 [Chitinophagaceae bacterium]|nr:MAG: hypothetical protein EOO01_05350 [Chitinophagaceae bacterium]